MTDNKIFSLVIPTKNRKSDLLYSLEKSFFILNDPNVECIIIDNGTDGTYELVAEKFPNIKIIHDPNDFGIFYLRNRLISEARGEYLIFLDDDVNFLVNNVLDLILKKFSDYPTAGVVAFRIFWGIDLPFSCFSSESSVLVRSFGAGACCIKKDCISSIPQLPEWFNFYGEEDFISLNLLKKGIHIVYSPEILVHHRVDLKERRKNLVNYQDRYRKSFRAGLFNIVLFYPASIAFYYFLFYSKHQILKIIKENGGRSLMKPILFGYFDLIWHMPKLIEKRNPLSKKEFHQFQSLAEAKLYWKSEISRSSNLIKINE